MAKDKKIKIIRFTVVKGLGAVAPGDTLVVGKDIDPKDATLLVKIKKAIEWPAPVPAKAGQVGSAEDPGAPEAAVVDTQASEISPMIQKAMDLAGVDTFDALAAHTDENLAKIKGIGQGMIKAIREAESK